MKWRVSTGTSSWRWRPSEDPKEKPEIERGLDACEQRAEQESLDGLKQQQCRQESLGQLQLWLFLGAARQTCSGLSGFVVGDSSVLDFRGKAEASEMSDAVAEQTQTADTSAVSRSHLSAHARPKYS
ncbi:hypothetical protein [Allorhodopirellula solitaria]|uniref:Uncharacterized protein n=1 Tax=Allorhodopirellula solitaria TaxID=2527987 RepID=A0A5C5WPU8_9BACT|nr:hypothetical protein [Allorhodopirellula solitaria]TWT52149.1 hypothetical protein CA85_50630 [Allorhodopirellula solitaria]